MVIPTLERSVFATDVLGVAEAEPLSEGLVTVTVVVASFPLLVVVFFVELIVVDFNVVVAGVMLVLEAFGDESEPP